jgi:uncharacterized integral membrane protein
MGPEVVIPVVALGSLIVGALIGFVVGWNIGFKDRN